MLDRVDAQRGGDVGFPGAGTAYWTRLGKVESFPEMKGKLHDQAEGVYEGV